MIITFERFNQLITNLYMSINEYPIPDKDQYFHVISAF